jgi:hypothetical protein
MLTEWAVTWVAGNNTVTLNKVTTTKVLVHDGRRRFRFIGVGYAAPVSGCFYKQTIWGLAKICPELYPKLPFFRSVDH